MVAYLLIAFILNFRRYQSIHHPQKEMMVHVFDASTFAGSAVLLVGIASPDVLREIGDTKPFLLIASLAGLVYSLSIFFPKGNGSGSAGEG